MEKAQVRPNSSLKELACTTIRTLPYPEILDRPSPKQSHLCLTEFVDVHSVRSILAEHHLAELFCQGFAPNCRCQAGEGLEQPPGGQRWFPPQNTSQDIAD